MHWLLSGCGAFLKIIKIYTVIGIGLLLVLCIVDLCNRLKLKRRREHLKKMYQIRKEVRDNEKRNR